jgi:hypothetical protein
MIDHLQQSKKDEPSLAEEYRRLLQKSDRTDAEEQRLTDIESMEDMHEIVEKIQDEVIEAAGLYGQAHRKSYEDSKAFLREHVVTDTDTDRHTSMSLFS